jgi:uncharacterized protein YoaH (UPF0181 family)
LHENAGEGEGAAIRTTLGQLRSDGSGQATLKEEKDIAAGKPLVESLFTDGLSSGEAGKDGLIAQTAGSLKGQKHTGKNEATQIELAQRAANEAGAARQGKEVATRQEV